MIPGKKFCICEWGQAEPFGEDRVGDEKFQEILCIVLKKRADRTGKMDKSS